jgi:ketosteroid isomerase-like protein
MAARGPAAPVPNPATAEAELLAAEQAWMGAVQARDRAALERNMADDFVLTGALSWDRLVPKSVYIENSVEHYTIERFSFDSTRVRVLGNVALVQTLFRERATFRDMNASGTFALFDVWVWRDGRWQVVERHSEHVSEEAP